MDQTVDEIIPCLQLQFDLFVRCEPLCPYHRSAVHDHAMYYVARQLGNFYVSSAAYESVSRVLSSQNIRPTHFHVHHGQPIALVLIHSNCMLLTKRKTMNRNYQNCKMTKTKTKSMKHTRIITGISPIDLSTVGRTTPFIAHPTPTVQAPVYVLARCRHSVG